MKIAVAGGTGFVGTRLVQRLAADGHSVVVLCRDLNRAQRLFPSTVYPTVTCIVYQPEESGDWQGAIAGCDGVVNLAGEPIAEGRWTPERKRQILESRQLGTRKLVEAINQANPKPSVLVNASAIGYYGTSETATFDESSAPGSDFLAQVCQSWETEAQQVQAGTRLVILRIGIVLGMGGAIARMLLPFELFAGGPIGSGRQWFSWIHREDLVSLIMHALTQPNVSGVLNATAPNPVRMSQLCQALGEVLHRPSWLPVPDFVLHALLGDGAIVVLEGQQVVPKQTLATGFTYRYPEPKAALEDIINTSKTSA